LFRLLISLHTGGKSTIRTPPVFDCHRARFPTTHSTQISVAACSASFMNQKTAPSCSTRSRHLMTSVPLGLFDVLDIINVKKLLSVSPMLRPIMSETSKTATRRMAIANGTSVSICSQPKAHYLATSRESRRYVVAFSRSAGAGIWLRQESLSK